MARSLSLPVTIAVFLALSRSVPGQVISEIHYHPPLDDAALEFVEIANDSATPRDLSGWAFIEGIAFEFPPGTILEGKGHLVVAADADALEARHGITGVLGNFTGRLENSGERLTLADHAGITVQSIRYRDEGKWPVAPDGTGHTLSLRSPRLDPGEPESWAQSPQLGGTPGKPNFGGGAPPVEEEVVIDRGEEWRYAKGNAPFSAPDAAWLAEGFDDAGWLAGPSGFGFGDGDDATLLADMEGSYNSVACRKRFQLSASDLSGGWDWYLGVDFDDGFCAFVNGREAARQNHGSPGQIPVAGGTASGSREAGAEALFPIPADFLKAGENVLALAGYNLNATSSDFSLIPRLLRRRSGTPTEVLETVFIARGEPWTFRKGTGPFSVPASAWRSPGFDDRTWPAGPSGFGYQIASGGTIAYQVPAGTVGNQAYSGPLGMDFDVLQAVEVTRLGVFDSGSDGLFLPITAHIYDRSSGARRATLAFTAASPGELVEGSRFKDLPAPLSLPVGFQGTVVAEGYGDAELNGNQGSTPMGLATGDGGGALSFVGGGRFGDTPGVFPGTVDGGPPDRYAAGTLEFRLPGGADGEPAAPPGVLTLLDDMPGGYTSIAIRRTFLLDAEGVAQPGDWVLALDHEDGFCAFLNGQEVARENCGAPGTEPLWNGAATAARPGGNERQLPLPRELLREGENLLALVGYSSGPESRAMRLIPRLLRRRALPAPGGESPISFNELVRGASIGEGWVELHNAGEAPADLSGLTLTDDPHRPDPHLFPPGSVIDGGGFLVLTEAASGLALSLPRVQLFLLEMDGAAIIASTFDRPERQGPPPGAPPGSWAECRFPDGGPLEWASRVLTPGAPNAVAAQSSIVINEIFYNPPEDRDDEFLELHNRGPAEVDLSGWSFDQGIGFLFPGGTRLPAGEHLVLARSPEALSRNHGVAALGPYEGVLSDRGERLRLLDGDGNPADEVRYFEGGQWSELADGSGSSLELIDPRQDNSVASAWEASDETGKAPWERLSFRVASYVPAAQSELHLYLVKKGMCLVDDVAIQRAGGANLIPNPGFEASTSPWLIEGTHIASRRITTDRRSGTACLQVIASGKGDTLVNRIETDTSPAMTAGAYDVSLWARWQRGASLLVVHGEYSAGPFRVAPCFTCGVEAPNLSGNPLSAGLRMSIPLDLGTPGAENGATRRLRESTGTVDLGPVISGVRHDPPSPSADQPVTVTARVSDAAGVRSVDVLYRTGNAAGPFDRAPLSDAGNGLYRGQIPGFPHSSRIVFSIEAVDTGGVARRFPVDAPARTCLYLVGGPPQDALDRYNLVLDTQRHAELQTRQLHSNDLVSGAFFLDDEEVHYDVGVRYRGSPWGRPSRLSYRVRFPEDHLFPRGRRDVNISKTGTGPNEGAALFLTGRNASPGSPSPAAEFLWIKAWLNGSPLGSKAMIEVIDGDFLEKWYGEDSRGPLLKAFGRFVFTDSGGLTGQQGWEGASLIYRGENPENYRGYYVHSVDQSEDRWEPLLDLTRLLDPVATPSAVLDRDVESLVDYDSFLRVHAVRVLVGDGDAFGVNNGHNGYLAFDSIRGRWGILTFDAEASFWNGSPDLFTSADPAVTRLLSRPGPRRAYLGILSEFANGYWTAAAPRPFFEAVQRATGFGTGSVLSFVGGSSTRVRSIVQPFVTVPFRITTGGGAEVTVEEPQIDLEGDAPVTMDSIFRETTAGDLEPLGPSFSTPTRWRATVPLVPGRNEVLLLGFDASGTLLGTARITVNYRPDGFLRGDSNTDLAVNVSDAIRTLFHLFAGQAIACQDAADFDDDGQVGIADAVATLDFLFRGGPAPAPPYPLPGADPGGDGLPPCPGA